MPLFRGCAVDWISAKHALPDAAVVNVRVHHTLDEIVVAARRHSPWVQPMPLHAPLPITSTRSSRIQTGAASTPEEAATQSGEPV